MRKYIAFLSPISSKALRPGALLLELQHCEARMGLRLPWQVRPCVLGCAGMHALTHQGSTQVKQYLCHAIPSACTAACFLALQGAPAGLVA